MTQEQGGKRIRGLYDALTDLGEEASNRIALRPSDLLDPIESKPSTAQPEPAAADVSVRKSPGAGTPPVTRTLSQIANPFRVCASAFRIISNRRPLFFGLGAVFVTTLSIASSLQYDANLANGFAYEPKPLLQLFLLGLLAYVLCGWIRVARLGGVRPFKKGLTLGHLTIAVVVGSSVYFCAPIIHGGRFETDLELAAGLTEVWPYFGPYGSMIDSTPQGAILLEPFMQAAALAPILLFMPLVVGEYQLMTARWAIFVVRIPFVVVSVLVAIVPIAVLILILADWSYREIAAGHGLLIACILSPICYCQIVITAVILGDCYRRIFNPGS